MKTIQLKIDDSRLEAFLTIIRNLKSDIVKDIIIKDAEDPLFLQSNNTPWIEEVSDEENEYYIEMFKNMSDEDRVISSKEKVTI